MTIALAALMIAVAVATGGEQPDALRVTVTHFQDRTGSDQYLWLRGSLADQLRILLSAGGATVVDYDRLDEVGREQAIERTGLPDPRAAAEVEVAKAEVAVTGEYWFEDGRLCVSITASRVEPSQPLARVSFSGDLGGLANLLRQNVPTLLTELRQPPDPASLERIRTVKLPSYGFQRWYHEGQLYHAAAMYPEAWYCFRQAVKVRPDHVDARRREVIALRAMGMLTHAAVELEHLVPLVTPSVDYDTRWFDSSDETVVARRLRETVLATYRRSDDMEVIWETLNSLGGSVGYLAWVRQEPVYAATDRIDEGVFAHANVANFLLEHPRGSAQDYHRVAFLSARVDALRCYEWFARTWIAVGDEQRAMAALGRLERLWQKIRDYLVSVEFDEGCFGGIEVAIAELKATVRDPADRLVKPAVTFTPPPAPLPKSRTRYDRNSGYEPDTLEWSETKPFGWVREFRPVSMLQTHDGQTIAVGTLVEQSRISAQALSYTQWMAYICSDDGEHWSDPVPFPAPINMAGAKDQQPVLIQTTEGTFMLAWVSNRNKTRQYGMLGRDVLSHAVYVSRSHDLIHWSYPIQTPGYGAFDMVELSDGSLLLMSYNTLMTRSYDGVTWTEPRVAITDLSLQLPTVNSHLHSDPIECRLVRLIVTDDRKVHLVAYVSPGHGEVGNSELFVHAVSSDGEYWARGLTYVASRALGWGTYRVIGAAPYPGGGLITMIRPPMVHPRRREPKWSKSRCINVLFRPCDGSWTSIALIPTQELPHRPNVPPWGGLMPTSDGSVSLTLARLQPLGRHYRRLIIDDDLVMDGVPFTPLVEPDIIGPPWTEDTTSRNVCLVFDVQPLGRRENHIANSLALLVQCDLQMLDGVQPLMTRRIKTKLRDDLANLATACAAPAIRWADYVVKTRVDRQEGDVLRVQCSLIDVAGAAVSKEFSYTCRDTELPDVQKNLSTAFRSYFDKPLKDEWTEDDFVRRLATRPRSFIYLSEAALLLPGEDPPVDHILRWIEDDPDSLLPGYFDEFTRHLIDTGDGATSALALRVSGASRKITRYVWRHPFDPFVARRRIWWIDEYRGVGDEYWGAQDEAALRRIPDCIPMRATTVSSWARHGLTARAKPHLDYLEAHGTDDPMAITECARGYEHMGHFGKAAELWQYFLQQWPDDDRNWPYWYEPAGWGYYEQMYVPARARLAMARIRMENPTAEALSTMWRWFHAIEPHISESKEKALALAYILNGLLQRGETEEVIRVGRRELHARGRPEDWLYYQPATVFYVRALIQEGGTMEARYRLGHVIHNGYWMSKIHRAFDLPPEYVLEDELRRIQKHHPLMGS